MKKNNKKGFTLAELLIVVAIIAVLVAIAIPVFTTQLEKSREATDLANLRSAYAAVITGYLTDGADHDATVSAQQKVSGWNHQSGELQEMQDGSLSTLSISEKGAQSGGAWKISITTSGSLTINCD